MRNWITGELLGTFLLVFFGCGSVASAVTTGALVGVFQVAIVWGFRNRHGDLSNRLPQRCAP